MPHATRRPEIGGALPRAVLIISLSAMFFWSPSATAETLREALAAAYRTNPELDAERARLRATDEKVSQAHAAFRPQINADGSVTFDHQRTSPPSGNDGSVYPKSMAVSLSQPIFRGFRTIGQLREAEALVRAGREGLRNVEQGVLLEGVTVYMNVVRDQSIVKLNENNVNVLSRELRATQDRFNVGEVTRTDVAQARSRRSVSVSSLELARANLKTSRGEYQRVIGFPPGRLTDPVVPRERIPKSLEQAVEIAFKENPTIIGALYREEASRHVITQIRGQLLPEVSVEATHRKQFDVPGATDDRTGTTVVGRLSVPIYTGGLVSSRVREAKHEHVGRLQDIEQFRVQIRSLVIGAWSQLEAARAQLISAKTRVEANRTALQGVREEERVGQRTLLDVLNAEQELLNSEVDLVANRRTEVVSAYTLLARIGRLTAEELALNSVVYDPTVHYNEVRRRWWGLSITHADGRKETVDNWSARGQPQK